MKALLLTLGLVALSALAAVARWGPGEAKEIDGVIAAPQLGELASPRRKETERPLLVEDRTSIDVAQAITEGDPEKTPAESTRRALTESDVAVLERSFEARHYDATKEELREVYDLVMERIPRDIIRTLHVEKLEQGDFELIPAKTFTTVDGHRVYRVPKELRDQNKPVLSLTHYPLDGTVKRTWIEPADMGAFEQEVYYANWLIDRIRGLQLAH